MPRTTDVPRPAAPRPEAHGGITESAARRLATDPRAPGAAGPSIAGPAPHRTARARRCARRAPACRRLHPERASAPDVRPRGWRCGSGRPARGPSEPSARRGPRPARPTRVRRAGGRARAPPRRRGRASRVPSRALPASVPAHGLLLTLTHSLFSRWLIAEISSTQRRRSPCSRSSTSAQRPVEVEGHEGHLLVQRRRGGSLRIPPAPSSSTSNACSHCGHDALTVATSPLRLSWL